MWVKSGERKVVRHCKRASIVMGKGKGNRNMPGKGKAKKTAKITWWVFGGRGYLVAGNAMYDEYDSAENEGRERESW